MNPAKFALRRPWTVIVVLLAIVLTCGLALRPKSFDTWLVQLGLELPVPRMAVDIFPSLNLPVIYVCQPYGGMDAAQMEGLLTNYYEYHFLYISNIHHVESRNIQGMALMKLFFHPGTNMAQAMAETINYVNRSRAFMPPGTVSPFVMRFDTGSVPVGYRVLSSGTRTIGEIQDQALFKVRPLFSSLPGVSAPPPFGGSVRSIVVRAKPDRLRAYGLSPDDVVQALSAGNTISPSGNLHLGDSYPVVPTNALIKNLDDFGAIPLRQGPQGSVYLRDIGTVEDSTDRVALGLRQRPELAECRELVEQACQKLGRERLAPLIPSVILGLSYGAFGGGLGSDITHTNDRLDADMVAYWEVRNLGVGERSARSEAASQVRQEQWRNAAQLDRVAEEVTSAHARVQTRSQRIDIARQGIASAEESFRLNCERIEQAQGLPIEVLQSIQSLATARREYLSAVVDFNIAQLELWWATGWFATPELHAETSNDS